LSAILLLALRVVPVGKDAHRSFGLNGDALYDLNADSATFGAAVTVDRIFTKTFVNCSPALKETIVGEAAVIFQRRYRGSPLQDAALQQEAAKAQMIAGKPTAKVENPGINPVPVMLAPMQQGQQ
jgi:hypothetical protein